MKKVFLPLSLCCLIVFLIGATSNSFDVTGLTAPRTFTFPDANATIARTDAGQTFTGVQVMTSPTLITPALGTVASGVLTNCTGLPEAGLTLANNTTNNVSATAHGFCPIFPNNTTTFLRGDGTYAAAGGALPVNSSGAGTPAILNSASTTITGTGNVIAYANTASGATLTSGTSNTIVGNAADVGANTAANSVAIGSTAVAPTGGTVIGNAAGKASATAARFTCIGNTAGAAISSGADNVFVGHQAGTASTTSAQCTFIGSQAGATIAGGITGMTCIGYKAGNACNAAGNVFVGQSAGIVSSGGNSNTYIGASAGLVSAGATDSQNTFLGSSVGIKCNGAATGANTLLGYFAGGGTLTTGDGNTIIGANTDTNAAGTADSIIIAGAHTSVVKGSTGSVLIKANNVALTSSTTNDFIIESGDVGLRRVAAKVTQPTDGAGTGAWFQETAGTSTLASNYTNATSTFSNTALSCNVITGRKYNFHCVLIYANSTAGEGAQFDFNGGSATSTNFVAGSEGGINDTVTTTLAGTYSQATVTGNNITVIDGTFEPSSTSTFIVRAAEVSHTTGTLTVLRGSHMHLWDSP